MTNSNLIHVTADALIETHSQNGTEWFECEGCAKVERAAPPAGGLLSG